MRDFSIEAYKKLLTTIKSAAMPVFGVAKWIKEKPQVGILLRHDVDRKPLNALKIAKIEKQFSIASTYYFRITPNSFDRNIIKNISDLGHEVGYHYEDLSLAKGNYKTAIELFRKNLQQIREITSVETISMHGRPFSPYDNRDLWSKYKCGDFGIIAEAFLDIDYSDIYYLTDTARTWGISKANIRDKVKDGLSVDVDSTESLISFINRNKDKKIALVMHPERWEQNPLFWLEQLIKDYFVNFAKCLIKKFY